MSDIWAISDTHFHHKNIIEYCQRPFDSVEQMDAVMVENWNATVKPGDTVWHLGDVYFHKRDVAEKDIQRTRSMLQSLNGRKNLILGNHDLARDPIFDNVFERIMVSAVFKKHGLMFTHFPVHQQSLILGDPTDGKLYVNVHGHIHNRLIRRPDQHPDKNYQNISVELTDYKPVNLIELIEYAKKV